MEVPSTMAPAWTDAMRFGLKRVDYAHAECIDIEVPYYAAGWRPDEYLPTPVFDPGVPVGAEVIAEGLLPSGEDVELALELLYRYLHLSDNVLHLLLKDLEEYFGNEDLRNTTDGYVRDACQGTQQVVLVGFSMGSVVGYHILVNETEGFPVKSFVTCGSPMTDPKEWKYVTRLAPGGIAVFPPSLRMWANIWDDHDPATTHHDWSDMFPSGRGLTVQSQRSYGRPPEPWNPAAAHNPFDYLTSKSLASAVATALSVTDR
jgi:pimeloyl-ACP methyl ester carboxylesterase